MINFPDLIFLTEFNGDFKSYFAFVYSIFENDFIKSQPFYKGLKVTAQKHPEVDGIHRTFYHITHEGEDEKNRTPDFYRMERIRFPRFIIQNNHLSNFLIWENIRKKDNRILIFCEEQNYLVVLTKRSSYLLFWTAYFIENTHTKRKLLREYESYIKTKTA